MTVKRLTGILAACLWLAPGWAHETEALYLGNEGVLVSHGGTKVLFDAFYSEGHGLYVLVSGDTRADLIAGRPPFDGIDAVFVSHVHGDHFSPEPTLAYLRAQPRVRLFASLQVIDVLYAVAGDEDASLLKRLTAFDLEPGDPPQSATVGEIRIDVAAISHSGGERHAHIRNLAFRAKLGDWPTVLHLGDAETDRAQFAGLKSHWDAARADIALPPYWFFGRDAGWEILDLIDADRVIGIHVPAEAIGQGEQWRRQAGADLFTDPGEVRRICGHEDR